MKNLALTSLSLAAMLTLGGCGDATEALKDSLNSSDTTQVSGVAVDPELMGATVFVDVNGDGVLNEGETFTSTDNNGTFSLEVSKTDLDKAIVVLGGVDKVTLEEFSGTFSALLETSSSKQNITPLTTLVHKYKLRNSDKTIAQAKEDVATALNLQVSDIDSNPMLNPEVLKIAMQLESIAQLIDDKDSNISSSDVYEKYVEGVSSGASLTTMVTGVVESEGITLDNLDRDKLKSLNNELGKLVSNEARSHELALSIDNIKNAIRDVNRSEDLDHDFFDDDRLLIDRDELEDEMKRRDDAYKERTKDDDDEHDDVHTKLDLSSFALSNLDDTTKYSLAYMWNEERLAFDIYNALGALNPESKIFTNIAQKGEAQHIALVEELIERYDLNITNIIDYGASYSEAELRAFEPGTYSLNDIQELYNTLYEQGKVSTQAALEVGCTVEVVDINDLNEDIISAQEINATDVVAVLESLRSGSYSHYYAFDNALKNMGVSEGCAVLGEEYAKVGIYPQVVRGSKPEQTSSDSSHDESSHDEDNFPEGKGPKHQR